MSVPSGIFQNTVKLHPFPPTSRYFEIETTKWKTPEGKSIVYIRRRFLPSADRFELLLEHSVVQGDRIDNVTAQYLGDPEQFWRVCDANNVMQPDELTATSGGKIRITLPEGIPGAPDA
ncbi:MAG TPA: hypothetical protein VGW57_13660 [Chthoniobacterales bacterium]|nr:hypothetical protein [Chthoniobacterales bacterium]